MKGVLLHIYAENSERNPEMLELHCKCFVNASNCISNTPSTETTV